MKWNIDDNKYIFDEDNDEHDIAELVGPQENRRANGLLICAAPQLLEALSTLVLQTINDRNPDDPAMNMAIKALCKARGVDL